MAKALFKHLKNFKIVLVTGPQRSGTRIAARCIAADTGFQYIDENEFKVHDRALLDNLVATRKNVVIQCPAMAYIIHTYGARDDVIVVFMLRELYEIEASEQRINWQGNERELAKYKQNAGRAATFKYAYWLTHQRQRIKHWNEVQYESLANHQLWVAPEQRVNFSDGQWRVK